MNSIVFVLLVVSAVEAYKPVMFMHGYSLKSGHGSYVDFNDILSWLAEDHPGQKGVALNVDNSIESGKNLWQQIEDVSSVIRTTVAADPTFSQGYHVVGHSQGGLLMRCVLESMPDHNVDQFVSMAGIQGGIYGDERWEDTNMTAALATKVLYKLEVQNHYSIANAWRTPDYQRFLNHNIFLPYLNNLFPQNYTEEYKTNFLRINHVSLFGSPDDGYLMPWYTTLFDFFDEKENRDPMTNQVYYTEDTFGLRTLDQRGGLTLTAVDGVDHSAWLHNRTIFEKYILPLLY